MVARYPANIGALFPRCRIRAPRKISCEVRVASTKKLLLEKATMRITYSLTVAVELSFRFYRYQRLRA